MSIIEALILGLVQGLTEFIPVSSSGHLLLLHEAFGITAGGLAFDVALHIGTLAALLAFFWQDMLDLLRQAVRGGPRRRLAVILGLATIPAALAGVWLQDRAETSFRSPFLVCLTLAGMALIMIWAEKVAGSHKGSKLEKVSLAQGVWIGMAQAIALIPGVSRSGSTISAGLFAGLDRVAATRFSFLLSIPITAGAIIKIMADAATREQINQAPGVFGIGIVTAFLSGAFAIRFLLRFVAKHNLNIFAYYRLLLAATALVLLLLF